MKFSDLPLNVPVLVDWFLGQEECGNPSVMVRVSETRLWDEEDGCDDLSRYSDGYAWESLVIVDQPTDEDAKECGEVIYYQGTGQRIVDNRDFRHFVAPPLHIIQSPIYFVRDSEANLFKLSNVDKDEEYRLHKCTCSLYGATGLLAIGCQCNGK